MRVLDPEVVDALWAAAKPLLPAVMMIISFGCHNPRIAGRAPPARLPPEQEGWPRRLRRSDERLGGMMQLRNRNSAASDETAWSRIKRRHGAGLVDARTRGASPGAPEEFGVHPRSAG